jgi:hypothetical protein
MYDDSFIPFFSATVVSVITQRVARCSLLVARKIRLDRSRKTDTTTTMASSPPQRLRSPRGSPRGSPRNHNETCLYCFVKYGRYSLLGMIPLMILSLLRPMESTTPNIRSDRLYEYDTPPIDNKQRPTSTSTDVRISEEEETPLIRSPPKKSINAKSLPQNPQLDEDMHSLLSSYDASIFPVLPDYKPSAFAPLAVKFLVDVTKSIDSQSKFLLDGLERSHYTRIVELVFQNRLELKTVQIDTLKTKPDSEPYIWMVDWASLNRDCHALERVVLQQPQQRQQPLAVVLVDFSASDRQVTCPKLQLATTTLTTRLVKLQIVHGRHYDGTWINTGTIVPNQGRAISSGPVLHGNMVVRELMVQAIVIHNNVTSSRKRNIDVATFWNEGDVSHYSRLRRHVTSLVQALHKTKTGTRTIKAHVGVLVNNQDGMEQGNIQLDYVQQLLDSKLVVVTQRDEWEDHLRLYDSLASGALILTDHMHTLPAGFANTTNIVVYDSLQSLQRLIRYYLHPDNSKKRQAIAKKGLKLAMSRHRSFHRIEQILFGKAMTLTDTASSSLDAASPPKRAHPPAQVTNYESFYKHAVM